MTPNPELTLTQEELLTFFPLMPVYESSRIALAKATDTPSILNKHVSACKGSVLALNLAKTPYIGLLITDENLAKVSGFEPVYPTFSTFLDTKEGVLYLFDRKSAKILPKELKGVDLELLDNITQRPFATLIQRDTPILLSESSVLPNIHGLNNPPALPDLAIQFPYINPIAPPSPLIEAQVEAQIKMFIGYSAYKAFFTQEPLSTYISELKMIYQQASLLTPLDHYIWMLTTAINKVQRETHWLLPANFSPETSAVEQLTFEALKQVAFTGIQENIDDSQKRMAFAVALLSTTSKMPFLTKMEKTLFIKFLVTQSRLGLNQNEMSRQLNSEKFHHYCGKFGIPIIEIVTRQMKGQGTIKCPDQKQLWWWEGTQYVKLPDLHIKKLVGEYVGFVNQHVATIKEALRPHIPLADLTNLKEQFEAPLCELPEELQPVQAVNLASGILKADGTILSHTPSYGMNYKYLVDAPSTPLEIPPLLNSFLRSAWGHQPDFDQKVLALQEALASTLFGVGTLYQRAILLYGVANSGKTQLLNIVRALIPNYKTSTLDPNKWAYKHNQLPLSQALLNVCGELSDETLIKSHEFKQVIDGSNSNPRSLATHWFASNHLPQSTDSSQGFSRRWLIFEFDKPHKSATPSAQKAARTTLDLGNKIALKEKDLITQWAMQAMPALQTQGEYTLPQGHAKLSLQIYNRKNVFSEFLSQSDVVEFVWSKEKYAQMLATPADSKVEVFTKEPYLFVSELVEQARFWVRGQGRPNNQTLSITSATSCLTEMAEQLGIHLGIATGGSIVFGVRLNTKRAKMAGALIRKEPSAKQKEQKEQKKLEAAKARRVEKILPWDRRKDRFAWRELD